MSENIIKTDQFIDQATVTKVSQLAKLSLTDDEIKKHTHQLSSILETFEKLAKVNTEGVEPLITPTDTVLRLRDDERIEKYNTEELMSSAPEKAGHLYKVPPVV